MSMYKRWQTPKGVANIHGRRMFLIVSMILSSLSILNKDWVVFEAPRYWPGAGRPDLPKHVDQGRTANIGLHDMKNYIERLAHLQLHGQNVAQNKPFNFAHHFAFLAWGAYEKQKSWATGTDVTMEQIIAHDVPGWNLVAQTQQDTLEAVDNIWLVQNTKSLDCVIAFEGTHSFQEFFGNLKGEEKKSGYCGLPGVHTGYADKLYWLMKYSMPKLRPNLAKCNKAGTDQILP